MFVGVSMCENLGMYSLTLIPYSLTNYLTQTHLRHKPRQIVLLHRTLFAPTEPRVPAHLKAREDKEKKREKGDGMCVSKISGRTTCGGEKERIINTIYSIVRTITFSIGLCMSVLETPLEGHGSLCLVYCHNFINVPFESVREREERVRMSGL